jgi:hypothetical protein
LSDLILFAAPTTAAFDTAKQKKLREYIFSSHPQPFEYAVFTQYITGTPQRQQQPSLKRKEAGLASDLCSLNSD